MFIDYSKFGFLNSIIDNIDVISSEYQVASEKIFLSPFINDKNPTIYNHAIFWTKDNKINPDDLGYSIAEGAWSSFPLYKIGFPVNWYSPKEHFPKTLNLLKNIPGLNYVSFMRLDKGAKVTSHKHLMKNYIFHLLMNDLDGECEFRVEDCYRQLRKKGDALLFDYSYEHASENKSSTQRIDFVIDFDPFLHSI